MGELLDSEVCSEYNEEILEDISWELRVDGEKEMISKGENNE